MPAITRHGVRLRGKSRQGVAIELRPMTEQDWDILLKWNQDPEILYYSEGDDVAGYSLQEVQGLYRGVSRTGFCFVIEADGVPIGECWLQKMNLKQIHERYPDQDCRRIDLMIGEKAYWGQGIGTEVIRLLTEFGFQSENGDMILGCHVADYNPRSLRAFQKAGYRVVLTEAADPGRKARYHQFLAISRDEWEKRQ